MIVLLEDALCAGWADTEDRDFTHRASDGTSVPDRAAGLAYRFCRRCPVRTECLIRRDQNAGGLWGGWWFPVTSKGVVTKPTRLV